LCFGGMCIVSSAIKSAALKSFIFSPQYALNFVL
jgi:hypothetical protein